jgi:hypothetical protein
MSCFIFAIMNYHTHQLVKYCQILYVYCNKFVRKVGKPCANCVLLYQCQSNTYMVTTLLGGAKLIIASIKTKYCSKALKLNCTVVNNVPNDFKLIYNPNTFFCNLVCSDVCVFTSKASLAQSTCTRILLYYILFINYSGAVE